MIRLGDPGVKLADTVEEPVLLVEDGPNYGSFNPAPFALARFTVRTAGYDVIPTAEIELGLVDLDLDEQTDLYDWQLPDYSGSAVNPIDALLNGRRVRIMAAREEPEDSWCVFEGFVERIELGWSGSNRNRPRWLRLHASSSIIAADRDPSQFIIGQWRRTRKAELALANDDEGDAPNVCTRVATPMIFNPKGRPNCHPTPLEFADGTWVYIPCDPDMHGALYWTVAKMLRYVQWAALQGALPSDYKQDDLSRPEGVFERRMQWTAFRLRHANLDAILHSKIDETTFVLDAPPEESNEPGLGAAVVLRALRNVAIDGMSVLEAFSFIAQKTAMLLHVYCECDTDRQFSTYVEFAIRGHLRVDEFDPGPGNLGQNGAITGDGKKLTIGGGLSKLVEVPVLSESAGAGTFSEAGAVAWSVTAEGQLVVDDSGRRYAALVTSGPARYEITVPLLPGWLPDAWWDVNPDDPNAVRTAQERLYTEEWAAKYLCDTSAGLANRKVGRYWVLNEDGAFTAKKLDKPEERLYQREFGPWKEADSWLPFDWEKAGGITDLKDRAGWSTRRRKFMEPLARILGPGEGAEEGTAELVGTLISLSFDGGGSWYDQVARIAIEPDRCAIMLMEPDLRGVTDRSGRSLPVAYIEGKLLVKVTALVEGDDATRALAEPEQQLGTLPWAEHLSRPGEYLRDYRRRSNNDTIAPLHFSYPSDRDQTKEAAGLAKRARQELEVRRCSGHFAIPYLLRAGEVPWDNYKVGDEIAEIDTGIASSTIKLATTVSGRTTIRAPRIVAVEYSWSKGNPPDMSTRVVVDDAAFDAALAGDYAVKAATGRV